jgi:hypothetical protein
VNRNDSTRRSIEAGEFRALLARLDPDPARAAAQYEHLRVKLIKFFEWEQANAPEELADDCMDRFARKLEEGVEVRSPGGYLAGIARMVLKEQEAHRRRERIVFDEYRRRAVLGHSADVEQAVGDLENCLRNFSAAQRDLILRYYQGDHARRIENRKRLAAELRLLPNALRNRAMRLRALLEACMETSRRQRDRSGIAPTIDERR